MIKSVTHLSGPKCHPSIRFEHHPGPLPASRARENNISVGSTVCGTRFIWRAGLPGPRQRGDAGEAAEVHAIDGTARRDDRAAALFDALVKHVHASQVRGDGVVGIAPSRLSKAVGDLRLGCAEDDASLALALGLRQAAHRIL